MKEILLFGKALNTKNVSPITVNELAISKGYVVDPECCNQRVVNFLNSIPNNYNTTFYASVADVVAKDRIELLMDQLLHYASTYGTEFAGRVFVVNENFGVIDEPTIDFNDCKVIKPITRTEIGIKVQDMLASGIALKSDTLDNLFSLIEEYNFQIDINVVKNIEAKMKLYSILNILPSTADEFVRYMVYQITEDTLLIKNDQMINKIALQSHNQVHMVIINEQMIKFGLKELSSVFFRYKPLFLALRKQGVMMRKITNKLRKLANKHHKPFVPGYWETILSKTDFCVQELMSKVKSISNFKLVRLIKAIDVNSSGSDKRFFLIRNGKCFIKENNNIEIPSGQLWMREIFMESLINNLKKKGYGTIRVKLPTNIRLAIPTSEKTYVGNIPFGSYIIPSKSNSIFGINWFGSDGAEDLDLSYMNKHGNKIGWNSNYHNSENSIIYSGDMTSARPEACEYMFCKKGLQDGVIYVNAYSAKEGSKYRFFVGKTDDDFTVSSETPSEDMIDFSAPMEITGESCVGFYTDGRIYFSDLNQGNSRVSNANKRVLDTIEHFVCTKDSFIYWDEILTLVGSEIVSGNEECEIDLSDLDVSTMISLLS